MKKTVTFLSKAGSLLRIGAKPIRGLLEVLGYDRNKSNPNPDDIMALIFTKTIEAESIGQELELAGEDKAKIAGILVRRVFASKYGFGDKIKRKELYDQGMEKIAGGFADVQNSMDGGDLRVD